MNINFDMDGTIVNFYGVEGWLEDLKNKNPRPYREAKPLLNLSYLARLIHQLQAKGYSINIISWLARDSTPIFDEKVTKAKLEWLHTHLPSVTFNNISIVKYGTPKNTCGNGILFDDEEPNRIEWVGTSYAETAIFETLKTLTKGD